MTAWPANMELRKWLAGNVASPEEYVTDPGVRPGVYEMFQ